MTNAEANTAANVAEQGATVAPEQASSKKRTTRKTSAPTGEKKAKGGKAKPAAPKKSAKSGKKAAKRKAAKRTTPRAESKGAKILAMISRPKGATLTEIMKATDWQAHSVRGFLSRKLSKQSGLQLASFRRDGERVYALQAAQLQDEVR